LNVKLLYTILIGIAITSISIGTVYAVLSQSASSGTNLAGTTTLYALKVNPSVDSNIAHIQVVFPSGFTFPTPRVFNVQNIGSGHISTPSALTMSYDVTSPVTITHGTQIVLLIGGIVNTNTLGSGQNVTFTTLDSSNAVIETGSFPLNIVSSTQDITDTGGKVGIGTSSPQKKLDVSGDIQVSGAIYSTNSSSLRIIPSNGGSICIGTGC
jgi:hypothetical protein